MKYIKIDHFIIIFYLICSSNLFSQTPPYYHYTSSEGLASSQVYEMLQDSDGYMWFATANGVSRFDGHKFKNFTSSDGLNSNSIITLTEGSDGGIYFGNEYKGFNKYAGGRIEKFSNQSAQNPVIIGMFTEGDQLYSYYANNICKVSKDTSLNLFENLFYSDSNMVNKVIRLNNGSVLAATKKGLYKLENQELKKISISGLKEQIFYWICADTDNNILLGAKNKIYEINNSELLRTIKVDLFENNNVMRLFKDSKGNIWFSIVNKGFYLIRKGTGSIENIGLKTGIEKTIVNNFLEDNEGNIWVSTYGEGVYCLNHLYLNNFSQKDGLSNNKITAIGKDHSDRMFIGTLDGLNVLEDNRFTVVLNKNSSLYDYMLIYGIKCRNDSVYVCSTHKNLYGRIAKSNYENDILFSFRSASFCTTQDNKFITGGWSNEIYNYGYPPSETDNRYMSTVFGDTNMNNKIHYIFEDSRNNLWFATTAGLCKMSEGGKTFYPANEILSTTIKYVTEDRNSHVWFAGDKGIASYRLSDSLITNYPFLNDHDLSSSNTLSVDKYNRLWIGSMNGLYILDKDSVKVLNPQTGLPSNEILSLCYDTVKNYMWIGSAKGLSSLDVSEFDNVQNLPVSIRIKNITADDSVFSFKENIIFEPGIKNIHIDFTAVNLSTPSSVKYQYNLEDEWIDISYDNINLSSLGKGDYSLAIRGKVINSPWGKPSLVNFTVLPYFTETVLFRASVIGLLIFGVIFGAAKRIKYIENRDREKINMNNQVNDLKHKALSSMMNPHFIFNSLNSVQYLINIDRKREANDYISLMAKLIRMNLETASESYIRLDEEIKRLDLYLQIEKLRFKDKFNYEIITDSGIDTELIMIPNMIIQPFVENSIWHGIMPSGRDGNIRLSFYFEDVTVDEKTFKFFTIRITDNGIGLTEAQKNKKDGHVSQGIKIIQERLVLLSKERKMPEPIFEDLNLKNKDSQGTQVVLSIPPELYRIISN
ncbi:MAG: histidine kinase [Bacteroidetes bacterium]|nr:histidine kinase [Bacteroidota bacterium]